MGALGPTLRCCTHEPVNSGRQSEKKVSRRRKNVNPEMVAINLGGVNCYLVKSPASFLLIDAGLSTQRKRLLQELHKAGCGPTDLKFVVMTHGDSDHAGNGAFLQKEFRVPIGMHPDDFGMVERGDMNWNRKPKADKMSFVMKIVGGMVRLVSKQRFDTFTPDVAVGDGYNLSKYGFDAEVVHLPGHSKGSVGVLLDNGYLFCGDFLYTAPGMNFVDDAADRARSLAKLKKLGIKKIFPGHGKPVEALR
jgi:hydroxyacylglutathione hydrolase